jgi:hypothetical protein
VISDDFKLISAIEISLFPLYPIASVKTVYESFTLASILSYFSFSLSLYFFSCSVFVLVLSFVVTYNVEP